MNAVPRAPWREKLNASHWLIAVEFALIGSVFVADSFHHIYLSKTPYLLVLGWFSLAIRGQRWRAVGLRIPNDWQRHLLIGILVGVAMELLELYVTQPLLVTVTGKYPDLKLLEEMVGNIRLLLLAVAASWVLAAVGEELVWRGYILNRVLDALGRTRIGWSMAVAIASLAFGLAHAPQGATGVAENTIDGALLAVVYVACGRNLFAPIIAHGVTDTLDVLIIFAGHYPGMN
jgi:membrane protease YdiL (CAAX protease family)